MCISSTIERNEYKNIAKVRRNWCLKKYAERGITETFRKKYVMIITVIR